MDHLPKNLLISGCPDIGKTSLSISLCRGFHPPRRHVPRRFEGWTIAIVPQEEGQQQQQQAVKRTISTSAGGSSSSVRVLLIRFAIVILFDVTGGQV